MKKTAPDGAVSGMPAIRETGPGKNLQAITVSTQSLQYSKFTYFCRPDKAFTPHPARCASNLKLPPCSGVFLSASGHFLHRTIVSPEGRICDSYFHGRNR
ncbi:hypothetical protein EYX82_16405 [Escherichia coli]|nr:hypothetical protein EYX82_16405 [Escherichia coli]